MHLSSFLWEPCPDLIWDNDVIPHYDPTDLSNTPLGFGVLSEGSQNVGLMS